MGRQVPNGLLSPTEKAMANVGGEAMVRDAGHALSPNLSRLRSARSRCVPVFPNVRAQFGWWMLSLSLSLYLTRRL